MIIVEYNCYYMLYFITKLTSMMIIKIRSRGRSPREKNCILYVTDSVESGKSGLWNANARANIHCCLGRLTHKGCILSTIICIQVRYESLESADEDEKQTMQELLVGKSKRCKINCMFIWFN